MFELISKITEIEHRCEHSERDFRELQAFRDKIHLWFVAVTVASLLNVAFCFSNKNCVFVLVPGKVKSSER